MPCWRQSRSQSQSQPQSPSRHRQSLRAPQALPLSTIKKVAPLHQPFNLFHMDQTLYRSQPGLACTFVRTRTIHPCALHTRQFTIYDTILGMTLFQRPRGSRRRRVCEVLHVSWLPLGCVGDAISAVGNSYHQQACLDPGDGSCPLITCSLRIIVFSSKPWSQD